MQQNGDYEPFTLAALQRIGTRLKLRDEVWGAVADWIDSDDLPRSGGAESSYYHTRKPPYSARNGKLKTLKELSLVMGVTPELFGKISPYLTIYFDSPLPAVNINTASPEILTALGDNIDERTVARIVEERRVQPFKSIGELSRVPELNAIAMGPGKGILSVKGNLFRITSVARVKDSSRTVEAVVNMSGGAPEFLSWQEY